MAYERTIFKGNPSVMAILGTVILCAILFIAASSAVVIFWKDIPDGIARRAIFWLPVVPLLFGMAKWIGLSFLTYEITTERIKVIRGLVTKRTDQFELYRVKDASLVDLKWFIIGGPFMYRISSVGNIFVVTNDAITPTIELRAIKNAKEIREQLQASIEECHTRKRTGLV
jgi:hypothetical protein